MTTTNLISAYTPSNMDPCLLERILVQREKLLDLIVRKLKRSMSSGDKHHFLLSGPRGCGKTYFLSIAHFRLTQDASLSDGMRIAWLGEDSVITSLVDLALEMGNQLVKDYPDEFNNDIRANLKGLPPDDVAEAILKDIIKRLGDRHLLLMMENLDRVFQGLGKSGQQKWRAFLQETGKIATLATTQQLFAGVSKREEAFYGFFEIHHLKPLSYEDALQLIANIAHEYKKRDLVDYLATSEGHFRVRALRHLAGGNHRMYIMLSEFLTRDSLDELVGAFEQLAEDLTPYFQERMNYLQPQQARVVQCLCNSEGALTVKAVAEETFIPERNCSKHLGELKKKGYVVTQRRGKESYYEMAEPLMRLCLEVKNQRGRPLRLIAQFLRAWFPAETLKSAEGVGLLAGSRSDSYRTYALNIGCGFEDVIKSELGSEILAKLNSGKYEHALGLADELRHIDPAHSLYMKAYIYHELGRFDDEITCLNELIENSATPEDLRVNALSNRGVMHNQRGDNDLALKDYNTVIENAESREDQRVIALNNRGFMHGEQGNHDLALKDYTAVIENAESREDLRVNALTNRGVAHGEQGNYDLALKDFTTMIENPHVPLDLRQKALFYIPEAIIATGTWSDVLLALIKAFKEVDLSVDAYGGTPHDILKMVLRKGSVEWNVCVTDLVRVYTQYGACDKLCSGLTRSIQYLDGGEYSESQLDAWNEAWQAAGKDNEVCEIALRSLDCAIRAIKAHSDRPLFDLPLEIRELVLPLLPKTCGKQSG